MSEVEGNDYIALEGHPDSTSCAVGPGSLPSVPLLVVLLAFGVRVLVAAAFRPRSPSTSPRHAGGGGEFIDGASDLCETPNGRRLAGRSEGPLRPAGNASGRIPSPVDEKKRSRSASPRSGARVKSRSAPHRAKDRTKNDSRSTPTRPRDRPCDRPQITPDRPHLDPSQPYADRHHIGELHTRVGAPRRCQAARHATSEVGSIAFFEDALARRGSERGAVARPIPLVQSHCGEAVYRRGARMAA